MKHMKSANLPAGWHLVCAALIVAWSAGPAAAQAPTGHEHHMEMMKEEPAPAKKAQVMASQPKLDGVKLVDAAGKTVALADALTADSPVLLNFIFTTCTTICPVMTAGFSQLERSLAADHRPVRLVSISIDPEIDTPAALRKYASEHKAGADWTFLTGTPASSEAAQRAFGAYRGGKESHAPITFIRRSRTAPWEQLDGLPSGELLRRAYLGE
jgi:protein SCO1/2